MPVYSYICPECGFKFEQFMTFAGYERFGEMVNCGKCNVLMKRDYSASIPAYHDVPFDSVDTDLTGRPIVYHTRGQLKEIAKQHGCSVEFGTSHRNHGSKT